MKKLSFEIHSKKKKSVTKTNVAHIKEKKNLSQESMKRCLRLKKIIAAYQKTTVMVLITFDVQFLKLLVRRRHLKSRSYPEARWCIWQSKIQKKRNSLLLKWRITSFKNFQVSRMKIRYVAFRMASINSIKCNWFLSSINLFVFRKGCLARVSTDPMSLQSFRTWPLQQEWTSGLFLVHWPRLEVSLVNSKVIKCWSRPQA